MTEQPKREDWETNRDVAKRAKKGGAYCMGCDCWWIRDSEKCPGCGHRNGPVKRRLKKDR